MSVIRNAKEAINVTFCRALLREGHKAVKAVFPKLDLRKSAWVYKLDRQHWEFHGLDDYYWHGRAGNAFEARYKGWMAWLRSQGFEE